MQIKGGALQRDTMEDNACTSDRGCVGPSLQSASRTMLDFYLPKSYFIKSAASTPADISLASQLTLAP